MMTSSKNPSLLTAKKAAGEAAAGFIQEGMIVGLGTGSTAFFFIEALGMRIHEGLKISAVATSEQSAAQARRLGIPLLDPATITTIDITVDGADEIDPRKNMIKGGGGALFREKLLAEASQEMVVVIDETKKVDHLGKHPLPVEIGSFLFQTTLQRIENLGHRGILRRNNDQTPFMTDNGNYIVDIQYSSPILDPFHAHNELKKITGVIETGFFFQLAKRVVIGYENGHIKIC